MSEQILDDIASGETKEKGILEGILHSIEMLIINISLLFFVLPVCFIIYIILFLFDRRDRKII